MENVSNMESKCCVTKKKKDFKSTTRISNLIIIYKNFRHRNNDDAKTPDALGTAADRSHRV